MTRLVQHAVDTCFALHINRVYVEASICARPMFEKVGFQTICENIVTRQGVQLLNYRMELLRGGEVNRFPTPVMDSDISA